MIPLTPIVLLSASLALQDAPGARRGEEAPATRPATTVPAIPLDDLRRHNEADVRKSAAEIPEMPPRAIERLIALRLDDRGLIEAVPVVGETDGVKRLDPPPPIGGLVNVNASPGSPDGSRPPFIDFQHVDFAPPEPGGVMHALQVFSRGDYLQISWDDTAVARSSRVQYIQAPQMSDDPQQNVRLYYDLFDAVTDDHLDHKQLSAASFPDLLRLHRDDTVRLLIAPLRRRGLHATLLATPPALAWQVLGDRMTAPPELARTVAELIARLDSERFADREAAAKRLREMGAPAVVVLRKIDRSGFSEEQRQAIETIVAQYARLPEQQATGLDADPLFLIGCLYADTPDLWPAAAELLQKAVGETAALGATTEERRAEADRLLDRHVIDPAARRAATQPTSRPS